MQTYSLNEGWEFGRIGECASAVVCLPHDAMLREARSFGEPGGKGAGWFRGCDYFYQKSFFAPEEWRGGKVVLEFEGVYRDAQVYINGVLAGGCEYGYSGFFVEVQNYVAFGGENIVRVLAFNSAQPNSRWYSGAGIYRPAWLHVLPQKHILLNGVKIKTLAYMPPLIAVSVATSHEGEVEVEICDGASVMCRASAFSSGSARFEIALPSAQTWCPSNPKLYTCRVYFSGDSVCENFGIRLIECTASGGFRLNSQRLLLRGACIHHDNGILGAAGHPFAERRKVALLKSCGYNALRSAHNPASKALISACDSLGMLVVDEYCDMWYIRKTEFDYADRVMRNWPQDLLAMIQKDYNHPSVIMYSLGNEVAETSEDKGVALAAEMTAYVRSFDDRPVTCGVNIFFNLLYSLGFGVYTEKKAKSKRDRAVGSRFFNELAGVFGAGTMKLGALLPGCGAKCRGVFSVLDVAGYNYGIARYKRDAKKHKDRIICGTETFCSDANAFMRLANRYPAVIGDFVWAGIDYLGEVGIGAWEYSDYAPDFSGGPGWISAGSGRLDLNGRPLGEAYYTRAVFGVDAISVCTLRPDRAFSRHSPSAWKFSNALPSWSWEGCEGLKTIAEVYTRCPRAALYLNGRLVARRRVGKNGRARFKLTYAPGELIAVGLDDFGRELCRASVASAGSGTILTATPEQPHIYADELCYVRLAFTDEAGVVKPLARARISVNVQGGELLALGSACPYNPEGYLFDSTDTYYGEALAVIRPLEPVITLNTFSRYGNAAAVCTVSPRP